MAGGLDGKTARSRWRRGSSVCGISHSHSIGRFHFGLCFLAFDVLKSALSFLGFIILLAHNRFSATNSWRLFDTNMLTEHKRFNTYLALALVTVVMCSCQTPERSREKEASTLRLHLEVNPDGTERNMPVPVYREKPVMINVDKMAFLDESSVVEGKIVDTLGGFAIQIQFDRCGSWLLEQYSTARKGKRFAIFSHFGDTPEHARWLAAPLVDKRITNGLFVFTPDATRQETERIVRGLNNVAREVKKRTHEFPP